MPAAPATSPRYTTLQVERVVTRIPLLLRLRCFLAVVRDCSGTGELVPYLSAR
jgi:hypothetical protein